MLLVSQRIYQIVAGYEDTNDSDFLRHDPIFKIICDKIPRIGAELLASQPTISRLENQITKPEIINLCERKEVKYVFGFSNNAVLKRKINYLLDLARLEYFRTLQKARLFDDVYYAAKTWEKPRRIVMKAEWLDKGENPRFLVTNLEIEAQELYDDFYVQRGATSEHRIKEFKLGLNADRLSCRKFIVNQFRLFLCQAAYILMLELRSAAKETFIGNRTSFSFTGNHHKNCGKSECFC